MKLNQSKFWSILLLFSLILVSINYNGGGNEYVNEINSDESRKNVADPDFDRSDQVITEVLQEKVDNALKGFLGGFIENNGQKNDLINYYIQNSATTVGFAQSKILMDVIRPLYASESSEDKVFEMRSDNPIVPSKYSSRSITLEFLGSNDVIASADLPTGVYTSYFIGNDQSNWFSSQYFGKIVYYDLYDNIDLVYEIYNGKLKYEFFVYPGGNPDEIQLHWTGPLHLELIEDNVKINLLESELSREIVQDLTSEVLVIDTAPINYQSLNRDHPLQGSFKIIDSNTYGFLIPDYDPRKLLIIDPILFYSTFVSGNDDDRANSIAIDQNNNVVVTGFTSSTDFPIFSNSYNGTGSGGNQDVFVFKLSADGSTLLSSTYVSGSSVDNGISLVLDESNNAYVTGSTNSNDFPTVNAYNSTRDSSTNTDVFVFKLSADGRSLLYSTFVGGDDVDVGNSIILDNNNNAYVTGYSYSSNFPTVNAYNSTANGNIDVFVFKLSTDGSLLLYSTYVGGGGSDWGYAITLDNNNNAYVTGATNSNDFPTVNAYDSAQNGIIDVIVFKLSADGSQLLYSTYVGGNGLDSAETIALDTNNNVYVAVSSASTDFPTVNAYDSIGDGTSTNDVVVFKLSANGSSLLYSTYVGGSMAELALSMALDSNNNVYVTGHTWSTDFPTVNPNFSTGDGSTTTTDVFVFKLSAAGNALLYSTYMSGSDKDYGFAITLDKNDNIYVAGSTYSSDFITINAYDSTGDGISIRSDVFVSKIGEYQSPSVPQTLIAGSTQLETDYVNLVWDVPQSNGNDPEMRYRIYRGTISGSYTVLAETSISVYLDISVTLGQTYYYVVTAMNSFGESGYSNEDSAIIKTVPGSPQNIAYQIGDNFIYWSWVSPITDGGSPIQYYQIFRGSTSGHYDFDALTTSTNFNDTNVFAGIAYYYIVVAINSVGESELSGEIIVTPTGLGVLDVTVTQTIISTITEGETTITHTSITTVTSDLSTVSSQSQAKSDGSQDSSFGIWSFLLGIMTITVILKIIRGKGRSKFDRSSRSVS